jgi:hypothetical protein
MNCTMQNVQVGRITGTPSAGKWREESDQQSMEDIEGFYQTHYIVGHGKQFTYCIYLSGQLSQSSCMHAQSLVRSLLRDRLAFEVELRTGHRECSEVCSCGYIRMVQRE